MQPLDQFFNVGFPLFEFTFGDDYLSLGGGMPVPAGRRSIAIDI
jgi:hypothetical protein